MKTKVAVLMSTYNGHQFIKEQILSIVNQQNDNSYELNLYIRDDGSKDNTKKILLELQEMYSNINIINDDLNIGVKASFMTLLKNTTADFYFFSDQDDIWENNKVILFLSKLRDLNGKLPGLVYSELQLIDAEGNSLGETMGDVKGWGNRTDEIKPKNILLNNRVTGAAMAVNDAMKQFFFKSNKDIEFEKIIMHDALMAKTAFLFNNITFIAAPSTLYRQHGNNVIGAFWNDKQQKSIRSFINQRSTEYSKIFYEINYIVNNAKYNDIDNFCVQNLLMFDLITLSKEKKVLFKYLFMLDNKWKEIPFKTKIVILLLKYRILT